MPRRVRVDGYTILRELGSGRTGTTYFAVETSAGGGRSGYESVGGRRGVAIKSIERGSARVTLAIEKEVRIHRALRHSHIVRLFEVRLTEDYLVLIMEACRGGDLFEFLETRRKWLNQSTMWRFFYELLLAVQYLHDRCVFHRDIKPENILVTGTDMYNHPVLKLCDFGLAQECPEGLELQLTGVGTTHYVAPEVYALEDSPTNASKVDLGAADIWSCGVVLYAIATGRLPFADPTNEKSSAHEVRERIQACQWNRDTGDVPDEIVEIFEAIFVGNPSERPTVNELIEKAVVHVDLSIQVRRAMECQVESDGQFPQSEEECTSLVRQAMTSPLKPQRSLPQMHPNRSFTRPNGASLLSPSQPDLLSSLIASMSPATSPNVSRTQSVNQDLQVMGCAQPESRIAGHVGTIPRSTTEGTDLARLYEKAQAFESGRGVAQSFKEAFRWYLLAAEGGHPEAQYYVGKSFEQGLGVEQDFVTAQRWYRLAKENGYPRVDHRRLHRLESDAESTFDDVDESSPGRSSLSRSQMAVPSAGR
uniref:Protein kinase domain-containing protein n=1 Tax=Compsopogon caeruleus TaxID=31354 RepID=A0A7S1XFH9_9RHOD|mmetsp:Transcript_6384/g.12735  ORF Transcript_6384/g.12735 Transcript_6384/m.12735 type:complete len:534 (+) Transcript_6384:184-1785(+)|eukprot:CAMPEP_0184680098 /NCGR_PEP_ID=MMETSP0312-20130426/2956_1 /TAXON_ID=31354 /ORGANISM="Compsopogon coeruleus, Strain SAG 36.94" /LENGTH=533 /DNA_ID=CAMNT_0027129979 /DNA_START=94 /DNA_END=1695 /DNA_ORIENTATION=+